MVHPKRTAEEVGKVFAMRYYLGLKKPPEQLHTFYKADSKIQRPGLDGIMRDFTFSEIDKDDVNMVSSRGFDSVKVTSVISQDSINGGVLVTVVGVFTSNKRRRAWNFIQAFFLAFQGNGNYYASNDLFKFFDISEANRPIFTLSNVVGEKVPETEQVAAESSRVSEPNDASAFIGEKVPEIKQVAAESSRVSEPNDASAFIGEKVPEIKQVAAESSRVSEPNDASVVAIGQGHHASPPEIKTDAVADTIKGKNLESQVVTNDTAIRVTNLSPYATFRILVNAFERFGEIIPGGCEVRHQWGSSYGFVEFKEAYSAREAIKKSPIKIGRRNAFVEKKLRVYRSYEEQMRIHLEGERQYNQNRYGSKQVRGTGAFNFWEWKKEIDEQIMKLQEQAKEEKSRN